MILDHAFVLVRPWRAGQDGVEAADELAASLEAAGFRQGTHRRHAGQGTENRCFRFERFMLELLFVVSREEASDARSAPLALPSRLDGSGSPFGFASRPARAASLAPTFPSVAYRPAYLPPTLAIDVARGVPAAEPLWFHLPFVMPDDERVQPIDHANGARRLGGATLATPVPLGERSDSIAAALGIDTVVGPHHLTLRLDGDGLAGRVIRPHEHLPLTLDGRAAA